MYILGETIFVVIICVLFFVMTVYGEALFLPIILLLSASKFLQS